MKPYKGLSIGAAFTLVELLVVVAIIGILAAMLLPGLKMARDMAQRINCVNNIKQAGTLLLIYASDHETKLPPCYDGSWFWGNYMVTNKYVKSSAIDYYTGTPADKTFFCPSSKVLNSGGSRSYYHGNYGLNSQLTYYYNNPACPGMMISSVRNPAATVFFLDAGNCTPSYSVLVVPTLSVWYVPGVAANSSVSWASSGYVNQEGDALKGRHGDKINVCYLDGHVEVTRADLLINSALWDGN